MKNKIRTFFDAIFSFLLFYIIFYTLSFSFAKGAARILFCIDMTLLLQSVYLGFSKKDFVKAKEQETIFNTFVFTPINAKEHFSSVLKKRFDVRTSGDYIVIKNTSIALALSVAPLSYASLATLYKNKPTKNLLILCFGADKQAKRLAIKLPDSTDIWEKSEVYLLLKRLGGIPQSTFSFNKKTSAKALLATSSSSRLSKAYLSSSAITLAFSLFSPFRTYYVIFAVVLLCIAVIPPLLRAAFTPNQDKN